MMSTWLGEHTCLAEGPPSFVVSREAGGPDVWARRAWQVPSERSVSPQQGHCFSQRAGRAGSSQSLSLRSQKFLLSREAACKRMVPLGTQGRAWAPEGRWATVSLGACFSAPSCRFPSSDMEGTAPPTLQQILVKNYAFHGVTLLELLPNSKTNLQC